MGLPTAEERRIEKELRGAVSAERLQEHLEVFSKQFR
ncbi:MAG: hypothetical protein QOF33_4305, partial [Thermomicrobiales bacterium]|nr:hypothetical protein [Thermomicrobiales bacterium]